MEYIHYAAGYITFWEDCQFSHQKVTVCSGNSIPHAYVYVYVHTVYIQEGTNLANSIFSILNFSLMQCAKKVSVEIQIKIHLSSKSVTGTSTYYFIYFGYRVGGIVRIYISCLQRQHYN